MKKQNYPWKWNAGGSVVSRRQLLEPLHDGIQILGFVYKITNKQTGKFYVGKKLVWFKKRKGRHIVYRESDWETYWGSSNDLLTDIRKFGHKNFDRVILTASTTKWNLALAELQEQLKHDIMNPETNTYNGIINVRLRRLNKPPKPFTLPKNNGHTK